jgi:hypothetical protein
LGSFIRPKIIFFGGLMKKSFLYFIPAALILALLFAGCPTESDDESGGSGWSGESYQKDLDGIAVAFADGATTVYLKDNLHLENGELVVPLGKELDLSRGVTIDQLGPYAKLVVAGNIKFSETTNKFDIDLSKVPTVRLIATEAFINSNVEKLDAEEPLTPEVAKTRHIKANTKQVITFTSFNLASAAEWEAYINEQAEADNNDYIPILPSGPVVIDEDIAANINKYGSGRKIYLIADITLKKKLDIESGLQYSPPVTPEDPGNTESQFSVVGADVDGSLVIGGQAVFEDEEAEVGTNGGFSVLGTLTTRGKRLGAYVNRSGPLTVYILRLENGGGVFKGNTTIIGSLPSHLGASSVFDGDLTAAGSVIIESVTFNGVTQLNGPVEFSGGSDSVVVNGDLVLNGSVTFSSETPPDVAQYATGPNFKSFTYNLAYGTSGAITFPKPVTFNSTAKFSGAVTAKFSGDATFNDTATFADNTDVEFAGGKVNFAKPVTIKSLNPTVAAEITFGDEVTFGTTAAVTFGKKATFNGEVKGLAGDTFFTNGAVFGGDVSFPAGSQVAFGTAGLSFNGLEIGVLGTNLYGTFTPAEDAPDTLAAVTVKSGVLTVTGGTLTLGTASITINDGGQVAIKTAEDTGIVFGKGAAALGTGEGIVVTSNYTFKAGTFAGGSIIGLYGTSGFDTSHTVILDSKGFRGGSDNSGTQAALRFAGSYTALGTNNGAVTLEVMDDIAVDGVTLDLAYDEETAGTITVSSEKDSVIITLKGGTATVADGTVSGGAAGGIRVEGTTGVYGKAVNENTGYVVDGYIVSKANKLIAGTAQSGTITAAGTIGTLGVTTNATAFITTTTGDTDVGFALYPESFQNGTGVVTFINATGSNKRYDEQAVGGSIAVFAGTIAN